jgi:hypothetical protein
VCIGHGCVHRSWLCSLPHGYVYSPSVVDISPESKCRVLSYSLQTLVSETLLLLLSTVIYCSPCSNTKEIKRSTEFRVAVYNYDVMYKRGKRSTPGIVGFLRGV